MNAPDKQDTRDALTACEWCLIGLLATIALGTLFNLVVWVLL